MSWGIAFCVTVFVEAVGVAVVIKVDRAAFVDVCVTGGVADTVEIVVLAHVIGLIVEDGASIAIELGAGELIKVCFPGFLFGFFLCFLLSLFLCFLFSLFLGFLFSFLSGFLLGLFSLDLSQRSLLNLELCLELCKLPGLVISSLPASIAVAFRNTVAVRMAMRVAAVTSVALV
jgi:hypothetical protein